ncbi:hypothetical protein [Nostoc sp. CHAB 5715]|uniref:hypothetical protein n=1 Tax=Nostoc sp. CHAB 5715 TaxID=2780400 RepID=UPI001E45A6D0|nr:hypothetical protein [Nostoc sp. CHAB 5715]MCC5623399.1 hypothetical protein [Nostoc sp. CHAB 5715]
MGSGEWGVGFGLAGEEGEDLEGQELLFSNSSLKKSLPQPRNSLTERYWGVGSK